MFTRLLFVLGLAFSMFSTAEGNSKQLPEPLKDWQAWVQYQQEFRNCPLVNGQAANQKQNYLCAWPAKLDLATSPAGIKFSQQWLVEQESKIPLPGEPTAWPQTVTVNSQPALVLESHGRPYLILPKGRYVIRGEINWKLQPDSILIPSQVALVSLTLDGKTQSFVEKRANRVWLGQDNNQQVEQQSFVRVWVNRLISDNHPMEMTVAIKLDVGGAARQVKLTQFDLKKVQLKSISSNLNTRVDSQGNLLIQVKPGSHQLQLDFKIHGFPDSIELTEGGDFWPQQEIWAYRSNERLRSTQVEQASPIDAAQGFMPSWSQYPHYVLNQGEVLKIKQRNRGLSHNADSLSLEREIWLSFDNSAYYFFDNIRGSKSKDWRVNTLPEYRLTQLSNHGKERLITYDDIRRTGAEIRTPTINIQASGEVNSKDMQHASGWDIEFASSNVTINIPPGRKLISISGADSSSGDWMSQWNLIDLFFVLITVALVFKVFGLVPSIFATLTLVLSYHELNMPMFLWFNFTVAISLASKISRPSLSKVLAIYKWTSTVLLLLALLPFLAEQIRFTLYPQLEMSKPLSYSESNAHTMSSLADERQNDSFLSKRVAKTAPVIEMMEKEVRGSRIQRNPLESSYEQGAVIQAGKGRPNWDWQSAYYSWNGPVKGDESFRIFVLPELAVKLLRILMIVFSVLWLVSVFNKDSGVTNRLIETLKQASKNKTTAALFAICLVLPLSSQLKANEIPDPNLLKELQNRLYPVPECLPDCINISNANIEISGAKLVMKMDIHSGAKMASTIPSSTDWQIESMQLNGQPLRHVWKNKVGAWINLAKGHSVLEINARLKNKSNITIQFSESPKELVHQLAGWDISGVNANRMVSDSIQLTRKTNGLATTQVARSLDGKFLTVTPQEQSIEDLLFVTRRLTFATQWTMDTYVLRQAPLQGAITADIPLLSFEQPLEMTEQIKDNQMKVVIGNNSQSVSWRSSIQSTADHSEASKFVLEALSEASITESWQIQVYPNWNIEIQGVPAVVPVSVSPTDFWIYEYFPRAGEKLNLTLTKPPAAEGASVAIAKIQQNHTISKRKTATQLQLDYRATRAETISIDIGLAELKSLKHDGAAVNLDSEQGIVSIALKPGKHQLELILESAKEIGFDFSIDDIKIDQPFSNLYTSVSVPSNRWLLSAAGPGYGPAIVYWGELIFFIILAFGLSKLPFSPLNYIQWLILGLGMSTFSWTALALVAGWLLASEWRRQNKQALSKHQIAISWLTTFSTVIAVASLVLAVPYGLLQSPDMGVMGNSSYGNQLNWFLDQGGQSLGNITVYTLPLWAYKGMMLLWSTWLSVTLIKWLGWIWNDLADAPFRRSPIVKGETINKKQASENEQKVTKSQD